MRSDSAISRWRTIATKSATWASIARSARCGSYGALASESTLRPVTRAGLSPVRWS